MDLAGINQATVCLYCETYQKISPDYPINAATFRVDSEVPRCQVHAQYTCDYCNVEFHFNGIAWCSDCKQFTCFQCGRYRMEEQQFLVYDYYYLIDCKTCQQERKTLDYAEVNASHPFQTGDLCPEGELRVWLPFGKKIPYQPEAKSWGNTLLRNMTVDIEFEPVEGGDSKKTWDALAKQWAERNEQGDLNHIHVIIPQMLQYMDPQQKKVMDIACGDGTFTRELAQSGFDVVGTDISNLVDLAIEHENKNRLGIDYLKIGVHNLKDHFDENSFDQITCNMALMDIDDLPKILDNISYLLKPGGQFVFSITHPILAWPVVKPIKLPRDSHHNEDKGWLIDNYTREQPVRIHLPGMDGPMLYYPRMLSTYINALREYGLTLTALAEPVPEDDIIKKFPRQFYNDIKRRTDFMVFQTKLEHN